MRKEHSMRAYTRAVIMGNMPEIEITLFRMRRLEREILRGFYRRQPGGAEVTSIVLFCNLEQSEDVIDLPGFIYPHQFTQFVPEPDDIGACELFHFKRGVLK